MRCFHDPAASQDEEQAFLDLFGELKETLKHANPLRVSEQAGLNSPRR